MGVLPYGFKVFAVKPRFYVAAPPPVGIWKLPESVAHHIHVRRLKVGDVLTLFCGDGCEYSAVVDDISRYAISVKVEKPQAVNRESSLWIGLAQSLLRPEHMAFVLQKGVEMGVNAFQPLLTQRAIHSVSPQVLASRLARWQTIIMAACEQCGRNVIPTLYPAQHFATWVHSQQASAAQKWLLSPEAEESLPTQSHPKIWMMIGPEGGMDPSEVASATQQGWQAIRLGPRILRTETAALSAISAMQALWGDFCLPRPT